MKGKIISIVLILSLISVFTPLNNHQIAATHPSRDFQVSLNSLTPSLPIVITHDDNFTLYPSITGDGSSLTPYRIENLNITSIVDETAIKIYHTTKYFIIKNCYLRTLKYGIDLYNVSTGTAQIVDNEIEGIQIEYGVGIQIKSTNSSFVANNTILNPAVLTGSVYAMYFWWAHHTTAFNNTAIDSEPPRLNYIGGFESDALILINNTCNKISQGFNLYKCPKSVIANNSLDMMFGSLAVSLDNCTDSLIDNNYIVTDGGMAISIYLSPSNITNNILFEAGIQIWEFNHTKYREYNVENNKIDNLDFGFFVDTADLVFDQSTFAQIFLYNCTNAKIKNVEFNIPTQHIYAVSCNFLNITNNIFDCEIYWTYGIGAIYLSLCQNASVSYNYYYLSGDALYLDNSHNCSFYNNTVYDIGGQGVYLYGSNSTEIYYNLFQWAGSGVYIDKGSHHNVIHHNTFWICQGRDDSSLNIWYDINTLEGNYWSEYDGIGPYEIPGDAGAEDPFPLSTPPVPQIVEYEQNNFIYLITALLSIIIIPYIFRKRKKIKL